MMFLVIMINTLTIFSGATVVTTTPGPTPTPAATTTTTAQCWEDEVGGDNKQCNSGVHAGEMSLADCKRVCEEDPSCVGIHWPNNGWNTCFTSTDCSTPSSSIGDYYHVYKKNEACVGATVVTTTPAPTPTPVTTTTTTGPQVTTTTTNTPSSTSTSTTSTTPLPTPTPPGPTPTPAATTTTGSQFWEIVSGSEFCQIVEGGRCVSDGHGNYGSNERCEIKALQALHVSATQYHIESNYDFLTMAGNEYRQSGNGPQGVLLEEGAGMVWKSDGTVVRDGFTVCATTATGSDRRRLSVEENEASKNQSQNDQSQKFKRTSLRRALRGGHRH